MMKLEDMSIEELENELKKYDSTPTTDTDQSLSGRISTGVDSFIGRSLQSVGEELTKKNSNTLIDLATTLNPITNVANDFFTATGTGPKKNKTMPNPIYSPFVGYDLKKEGEKLEQKGKATDDEYHLYHGDDSWNVAGGVGEILPYAVAGALTPSKAGVFNAVKTDFLSSTPLTILEYGHGKDKAENITKNVALNAAFAGAGDLLMRGIGAGFKKTLNKKTNLNNTIDPGEKTSTDDIINPAPKATVEADIEKAKNLNTKHFGKTGTDTNAKFSTNPQIDNILNSAKKGLGTKYVWGGESCKGWDCSGFVQTVYKENGINLPRTADEQFKVGKSIAKEDLQKGDLVFFNNGKRAGLDATHVGIYMGGGKILNAKNKRAGTVISNISDFGKQYVGAKRVLNGTASDIPTPHSNITADDMVDNVAQPKAKSALDDLEETMSSRMADDTMQPKSKSALDDLEATLKKDDIPDIGKTIKEDSSLSPSTKLYNDIKIAKGEAEARANMELLQARANAKAQNLDDMLDESPLQIKLGDEADTLTPKPYNEEIGKSYDQMSMDELSSHPRYDELIDMRKDIKASQTQAATTQGKATGYFKNNEYIPVRNSSVDMAERNYAADFELTKADIKAIQKGMITPQIHAKLANDLATLDYHPDWAIKANTAQANDGVIKGMIEFGVKTDKELSAVISIFRSADVTTLPHELGHYFRRTLNTSEIEEAEKLFGRFTGEGAVEAEERFANSFVDYLATGNAPTSALKAVFEKFKTWIRDIFTQINKNDTIELSQAHKDFFDAIMGNEAKAKELFGEITPPTRHPELVSGSNEADELFQAWGSSDKDIDKLLGVPQELTSFGRNFSKFKNNPKGAIDHLIKVKNGQVRGALYHDEIGEIDIVWGKVIDPKEHTGYGLAHIIDKHGEDIARRLDDIIMGGKVIEKKGNRVVLKNNESHGVVVLDWADKDKKWVMTAYEPERQTLADVSTIAGKSDNLSPEADTILHQKSLKENKLSKQEWDTNLAEWHKDSHPLTKNADGSPKVFYHGTKADFDTFANDLLGSSTKAKTASAGHYFTDNADIASQYAKDGNVMPVHIDMKKPFVIDTANPSDEISKAISNIGMKDTPDSFHAFKQFVKDTNGGDYTAIKGHLQKQGYDGIVLKDTQDILSNGEKVDMVPHDSFVAFEPTQIKSIHNKGTFDPENPNILYQKRTIENDIHTVAPKTSSIFSLIVNNLKLDSDFMSNFTKYRLNHIEGYEALKEQTFRNIQTQLTKLEELHYGLKEFSTDTRVAMHRYMTGQKVELHPELKLLADNFRKEVTNLGQELVDSGVLSKETFDDWKSVYLHRSYAKHLNKESIARAFKEGNTLDTMYERGKSIQYKTTDIPDIMEELYTNGYKLEDVEKATTVDELIALSKTRPMSAGGIDISKLPNGKIKVRRDYTFSERQAMGEVEDIAYTLPQTLASLHTMVNNAKFLSSLPKSVVTTTKDFSEDVLTNSGFKMATGKKYGVLNGKWVNKDVLSDINKFQRGFFGEENLYNKIGSKLLRYFKKTVTVYNPGTHVSNLLGNISVAHMAGLNPYEIARIYDIGIRTATRMHKVAELKGKLSVRPNDAKLKAELKNLETPNVKLWYELRAKGLFGRSGLNDTLGQHYNSTTIPTKEKNIAIRLVKYIDDKAEALYSAEDDIYRFALAKHYVEKNKMSIDDAITKVNQNIPDYTKTMAPFQDALRRTGIAPFMSWTYHGTPMMLRQMWQHPIKAAAMIGIVTSPYFIQGINPFDEKQTPDGDAFKRIPISKDGDKVQTLKIDRWLPYADLIGWLPFTNKQNAFVPENIRVMYSSNPYATMLGFANNHDMYYNRKISYSNDPVEKNFDLWGYLLKGLATPGILDSGYNYIGSKIKPTEKRRKDKVVDPLSQNEALAKLLGVNVRTYNKSKLREEKEQEQVDRSLIDLLF
jgi:cell wall-associated NlpC family hydrolase